MNKTYERQEDGSLKPIDEAEWLVKRLSIYQILRDENLELDEIKFILCEMSCVD